MLKLHVVQAEYGDCFILESKIGKKPTNILIDGGPYQTYKRHLKPTLQKLPFNGKLDLMVLSHIDNDHIIGLLDLLAEIKNQRESEIKELVKIEKIWHNSFDDLLQFHEDPKTLLQTFLPTQNMRKEISKSLVMKGFQQGTDLARLAKLLRIRINPNFDKLIVVHDKIRSLNIDDITIHILGPTIKNINKLQKEWRKWFEKKSTEALIGLVQVLDKSIPNLASISFLVEAKNRKILFTGDGLGQDIVETLAKNMMLDKDGKFYVDVLKIPHHGSDRNSSPEFFDIIKAKYYIISANGRDDNPSLNTLRWIIESGMTRRMLKKIVLTNMTMNVRKIFREYDQDKYNYESIILKSEGHFMTISLK